MCRYKISVEYDGSFFCGWQQQRQDQVLLSVVSQRKLRYSQSTIRKYSVQGVIEMAVFNITGEHVIVEGAGRTDSGVHAFNQTAHFDLLKFVDPHRLQSGINFYTRMHGCSILSISIVESDFHARFSAKSREYIYRVINRNAPLMLDQTRAWHVIQQLELNNMMIAAQHFLGTHDFKAFRAAECQSKTTIKTVDYFNISKQNELIEFHVKSRSFLHNQVRIMVGTIVWIGLKKLPVSIIEHLLIDGTRSNAGPTAPAYGLYLLRINY
ncbi:MAG: tRNA pseudouridine(38-40) synthase TruA [Holosporales bacterium]|nr:tRNA pseudouridine(38-40) synthase TruA [Holosporales bacterium]